MIWAFATLYALGVLLLLHRPFWPYVNLNMEDVTTIITEQVGAPEPEDLPSAMLAHHVGWILNALLWPLTLLRNVYNWWATR